MVLLVGAGLFVLSLHRVRTQDFGFRSEGVLVANLRFAGSRNGPAQDALYRDAEERVGQLPGVDLATIAHVVPFSNHHVPPISVPGREDFPDERQQAPFLNAATPSYFRVLDMTIQRGRNFTAADRMGSPFVIIINQAMADGLWPGETALGKCIRIGFVPGEMPSGIHASPALPCREVVGVVNNARPRSIREEAGQARMQYYIPFGQLPASPFANDMPEIWGLLIRTADADAMARPVQRLLQSFTDAVVLAEVKPLQDLLDREMRPWLLGATMFSAFGVLALGLAAVGLYGVLAYAVAQRTQEIGIRMALGARTSNLVRLIVWDGVLWPSPESRSGRSWRFWLDDSSRPCCSDRRHRSARLWGDRPDARGRRGRGECTAGLARGAGGPQRRAASGVTPAGYRPRGRSSASTASYPVGSRMPSIDAPASSRRRAGSGVRRSVQ